MLVVVWDRIGHICVRLVHNGIMRWLLLILTNLALATELNTQDINELNFDKHWEIYLLSKHGCPVPTENISTPITQEMCSLGPVLNLREKRLACEGARRVFELTGDCNQ
jgi:hypothetical protein